MALRENFFPRWQRAPHQTDIGFIGFGDVDAKLADSLLRDGVDCDGVIACQLSPPVRAAMLKPQSLCGNLCEIWMKNPMPHVGAAQRWTARFGKHGSAVVETLATGG